MREWCDRSVLKLSSELKGADMAHVAAKSRVFVVVAGFLALASWSAHAQNFSPLLNLDNKIGEVPLLHEVLRDPVVVKAAIFDESGVQRTRQEIASYRGDLVNAQGPRRVELTQNIFEGFAVLAYYYEDVVDGKINVAGGSSQAVSELIAARRELIAAAESYTGISQSAAAKARGYYHSYATRYLLGSSRAELAKYLEKIKDELETPLRRRAEFLIALQLLDHGNQKQRDDAHKISSPWFQNYR